MALRATIEDLRALINQPARRVERERYEFSMRPEGFPRGALIELNGAGKTEVLSQFLAENSKLRVAWVEEDLTIYPNALAQRNVTLSQLLFVEARKDVLWATIQVLRSNLFDCVVLSVHKLFEEKNLRRLQLESEKGHVGIFFLTEETHTAWPVALQIKIVRGDGRVFLNVIREKA